MAADRRCGRLRAVEGEGGLDPRAGAGDAELAALVARGDTGAFEQLYDRHSAAVYGMVRQVLRDPAQSEDVAQEVWVEAWRTASRFDADRGSYRAWLVVMARRRAIDRVRSVTASVARDERAAVAGWTPPHDEVSETVQTRLEQQRMRTCLDTLTGVQRQSVELAFYRGYTHREVSDVLDVPLGTVKTRLRDGLIRLRDCMGVA